LVRAALFFAAFIDFQKGFDCTNRDYLLVKVLESGVDGKMYWAIKSLYSQNEACVKVKDQRTDWFGCRYGVRQGDTLSPTLFSVFINDLVSLVNALNKGINQGNSQISIPLYAEDGVLLADSEAKLQEMLNQLYHWSAKWKIFINKSKI